MEENSPVILNEIKEKHVILLDLFCRNEFSGKINLFMHYADTFETGKELVEFKQIIVTGDPNLDNLTNLIKETFEKVKYDVIFIAINSINGERCSNPRAIIKDGVQTLSMDQDGNGKLSWGLFKDILNQLGYYAKTDKHMHVKSVSYKRYDNDMLNELNKNKKITLNNKKHEGKRF